MQSGVRCNPHQRTVCMLDLESGEGSMIMAKYSETQFILTARPCHDVTTDHRCQRPDERRHGLRKQIYKSGAEGRKVEASICRLCQIRLKECVRSQADGPVEAPLNRLKIAKSRIEHASAFWRYSDRDVVTER